MFVVLAAPLLVGWVNQCRAWLQNRSAPSILLPYYTLAKLFHKDAVIARNASPLFRLTPYVLFGCMWLAAGIVPVLATDLPFAPAADIIALVGVFALARVFSALAAMDIGTSFGGLGARREMLIGFLAEPAMLMTLFTAAFISGSTQLTTIVETLGAPRVRDLPEPRLRGGRLPHGAARRERAHPDRQPDHAPRAHHGARGDDPRVLGAASGADRVGGRRSSCSPT